MKPVIFQAAEGKHEQLLRMTEERHRALFPDCDYHAFYGRPADYWYGWHYNFVKWYWLRHFLKSTPDGTVIFWLDADAVAMKWFDVSRVIPVGSDFAAVYSAYGLFNMGVFFWRNSENSRKVLEDMIRVGPWPMQPYSDGAAANQRLSGLRPTKLHTGFNNYQNARGPKGEELVRAFHAGSWTSQLLGVRRAVGLPDRGY